MSNDNLDTNTTERPDNIEFENVQNDSVEKTPKENSEGNPKTHEVVLGDSLTTISVKYDIPKDVLIKLNDIEDPNVLTLGQKLKLTDES